jgi:F-box protein 8
MGLLLDKLKQIELAGNNNSGYNHKPQEHTHQNNEKSKMSVQFPDLQTIPSELSLQILRHLNATDLCLAACVWSSLANDDLLWQGLCRNTWGYASIYATNKEEPTDGNSLTTYRSIFMHLDEATLTFNADWRKGLEYLFRRNLVRNDPVELAKFINSTKKLNAEQKEKLFQEK